MARNSETWESLNEEILACKKCPLANSRTHAVPGEGPQNAVLVIIGEAPGQQEDIQGQPFVGAAGQLLTQLLEGVGIERSSVFITNVVKCRPPENRQPTSSERQACAPYLKRQLDHIQPRLIALVGRVPAETMLTIPVKMGGMHGRTYEREGRRFFIMYHPAAGLYNQNLVPEMEKDMHRLKAILEEKIGRSPSSQKGQLPLNEFFIRSQKSNNPSD